MKSMQTLTESFFEWPKVTFRLPYSAACQRLIHGTAGHSLTSTRLVPFEYNSLKCKPTNITMHTFCREMFNVISNEIISYGHILME